MPIHVFNPSMPHDDPCVGGLGQVSGQVCGTCRSGIARAWKVTGVGKPNRTGGSSGSGTFFITDYRGDGYTDGVSALSDSAVTVLVSYAPTASAWFQFPNVPIPKNATVTTATLTLHLQAPSFGGAQYYTLTGSPSSSQPEPTAAGWYGLPRTTSNLSGSVNTSGLPAGTPFTFDVTAILQEIVTGSWAANGSVLLFMDGVIGGGGGGGGGVAWKALDSNADLPFTQTSLSVSWTTVNADLYIAQFMGDHVLQRSIDDFEDDPFQTCLWNTSIDLSAIGAPFTPGSIKLEWTSVTGDGGGDQWFLILTGLPAIGASPADVAFYKLNAFALGTDQRPFRCLSQNTFWREDLLGSGNFPVPGLPDSLLVQPFWP
jgi:hypothetical protein